MAKPSHTVACIDISALPMQLLLRKHPGWRKGPVAVVAEDHPQAEILWVNQHALKKQVRPGMRYGAALSIAHDLHAAPIRSDHVECERKAILEALTAFTPRIEPDADRCGVFWLDPSGVEQLFGPLERWALGIHEKLKALQFRATVIVGFSPWLTWAIARQKDGVFVVADASEEIALGHQASLLDLDFPNDVREALDLLKIRRLGEFLALPAGELSVRFGPQTKRLHALFSGSLYRPLQPTIIAEPLQVEAELDPPDDNCHRLLFFIKGALHALVTSLSSRGHALASLELCLELERHPPHRELLTPARPTRDMLLVIELVRLRLDTVQLPSRVERLIVEAHPATLEGSQLQLFSHAHRRDLDAANRGLARLCAAFGPEAVLRAHLADAWLPEHSFRLEPASTIALPRFASTDQEAEDTTTLIRRLLAKPQRINTDGHGRPLLRPPLKQMCGPYRLQGGWWAREVFRDYFYAEQETGNVLWLFHDHIRNGWFMHGFVN